MKWISFFRYLLVLLFFSTYSSFCGADAPTSFRQPHPLAWMHGLPTGEIPGWSSPSWFNLEVSQANVWNAPLTMNDKRNGRTYEYFADFEQTSAFIEFGHAFWDRLGVSLEIPYAYRGEGFLDSFIDEFHVNLKNRRFNRHFYPEYQVNYSVKTDGTEFFEEPSRLTGISNVIPKLKLWLVKWQGQQKGSCPCGISIGTRLKIPTQDEKFAGSTGDLDKSYLLYIGIPLFSASSFWMTGAYTHLGDNPSMPGWPLNSGIEMYEFNFDFAFGQSWGLILSGRMESPFLNIKHLEYVDGSTDLEIIERNRAASGWNSLVRWRGSNGLGFRYRTQNGNQLQFLAAEDWGQGPYDAAGNIYSNGAPDINFIFQSRFHF